MTITFENEGTLEHNLHLEATGTHLVAPAGQTVTATVVFPSAADLSFVCTVPGHEAAGMSSKLQVGEPNAQAPAAINATAQTTPQTALAPLPPDTPRVPQGPVAPPVHRSDSELVKVNLAIEEVVGQLADGVGFRYWTFGGTVPGPMIRVRQGDTVELTLTNPPGMEPPQGFPPVDREFYVMQSEAYLQGDPAAAGLHDFAFDKLLHEQPDYVMYNGSVGSLTDERAMLASVGERVRFFFGVGGPNLDSAFHVVGLAWDLVHPEGAAEAVTDVQTTLCHLAVRR